MSFKEEAIRRVNWDIAESWAEKVQEPEFSWKTEITADGYIVVGANDAITAGQHRILGGLMGNDPVPEEVMTRLMTPLPMQPWDGETGK